ncbi:MAG TPA: tetratricopeptide repeat protein, partial [Bacteroidia bacterium]|nr:tetratricopeptide repeat protein [Bacteroidia bacterium]
MAKKAGNTRLPGDYQDLYVFEQGKPWFCTFAFSFNKANKRTSTYFKPMKFKHSILILIFLSGFHFAKAQDKAVPDSKIAEAKFKAANYDEALTDYLDLLDEDSKNMTYNYRIGVCYLNTNINKTKAIPYLEVVTRQPNYEPDAMYLLGRAYHFAYRFDDAMRCYNTFKKNGKGTAENLKDADREMQNCYNAKEIMKYPLNVTFENLSSNINSAYPEY